MSSKEGRAALAPRLLPRGVGADRIEERACQLLDRKGVGAGRADQFAKLALFFRLQRFGLVGQRLKFGVEITRFTHHLSFHG